jgi:hypothetical protein
LRDAPGAEAQPPQSLAQGRVPGDRGL